MPEDEEREVGLRCKDCLYMTDNVRMAMGHTRDTGHTVTGPHPDGDSTITVSLERD
jgi:hypothetical protein